MKVYDGMVIMVNFARHVQSTGRLNRFESRLEFSKEGRASHM